jgi:hypothetical protein
LVSVNNSTSLCGVSVIASLTHLVTLRVGTMRQLAKKNPAGADVVGIVSCSLSNCYSTEAKIDLSLICLLCDLQNHNEIEKQSSAPCCPISTSNLNN